MSAEIPKRYFEKIALHICDFHVHVGQFKGLYFSPAEIVKKLKKLGISRWAVSSTSTCDRDFNFEKVKQEILEMMALAPEQTLPVLWISPEMLEASKDLKKYDILPFVAFKIHGISHKWDPKGKSLRRVFHIARERNIPLLIHTGGSPDTESGVYAVVCSQFPDVIVILAHGRPVNQAITVMKRCQNTRVDTAFMPIEDIKQIVASGLSDRILFGTDFPIDKYFYPKQSEISRYKNRVNTLVKTFGEKTFLKWANAKTIGCKEERKL